MKILVLNSGSSSLKYQVIDMDTETVLAKGNYERIGQDSSFLTHTANGEKNKFEHPVPSHKEAISFVIEKLLSKEYGVISDIKEIEAVGHRMVHGGEKFSDSVVITDEVIEKVKECSELAPLHNPAGLLGIEACKAVLPHAKMVGVFDTAFHQTIPAHRYIYPIPYKYYEKYGVRKYGFHGTSHKYVSHRVAEIMDKDIKDLKIVTCHLGQGASISAVLGGKCVETSMGLTPLAGIPMGSRSGDLDPSIVTFLMKKENLSADEIDKVLNKESGVYGVSGISVDFRDIETAEKEGNERAKLALDNYNYLVASYIARCVVAMNGVDVIVFTAGIGENGKDTRAEVCKQLEFLGIKLDNDANNVRGEEKEISSSDSKVKVYVVPTNEELMIAKETLALIK